MKLVTHLTFMKENIFIVDLIMEQILTSLENPHSKENLRYIVAQHLVPSQTLMLLAINTFVELHKLSR